MAIFQHYYTSCRNPETARTGFQVKAATPGLPRRAEQVLHKLIDYRPPGNADPQAVESHPVSLRFYVPNPQEALLICAQSNGPDEFGRPGNFFAHSLVGPVEDFTDPLPPIFYWDSPFWISQDPTDQTLLPEIKGLADAARVTFNYDAIWQFLTDERRAWLYGLLCAVLDYPASKRRIVIADTGEHTALWIAMLTMALPYQSRAGLSFATYHHDPYSVPFIVTGTTLDSAFRFTADDYRTYYVLDTQAGRASSAPDSDFARYVCDHFSADQYETVVLDLFMLLKRRAPGDSPDPARLDALTHFAMLQSRSGGLISPEQAAAATHAVIADVTARPSADGEDAADLRAAWELLSADLLAHRDPALLPDFLAALERLHASDPAFAETCSRACAVFAALVAEGQPAAIHPLHSLLKSVYPAEALQAELANPRVLIPLIQRLQEDDLGQLQAFWESYGALLTYEDDPTALAVIPAFTRTLAAADLVASRFEGDPLHVPREIELLLKTCLRTQKVINPVTRLAQDYQLRHPESPVFGWVYYAWVEGAPLDRRTQMRAIYSQTDPDIIIYELHRDLVRVLDRPGDLAATLVAWVNHLPKLDRAAITSEAMRFLWSREDANRAAIATSLLKYPPVLEALDGAWQVRLVEASSQTLNILSPDEETLALYQHLLARSDQALSSELKSLLQGVVSLAHGELHEGIVAPLNDRLRRVEAEAYRQHLVPFLARYFAAAEPSAAHHLMVAAGYVPAHREIFWAHYWEIFSIVLLTGDDLDTPTRALDFWFTDGYRLHRMHPYLLADFFLGLPGALDKLQADKAYHKIGRDFEALVRERPWAALLPTHFPDASRQRGFLKGLFERS
jgi:hypothetical protein